jgi:tRNA threonylcarbamoyladenosine biosynthesis protein TsaE
MNTDTTWQTVSSSSDATFAIGEQLGNRCRGGEVFVLSSDLGGGKTALAKGIAKGLGCQGIVNSPTFTISQVYTCNNGLSMHHFDFYRLGEPGLIPYELVDVINDPKAVTVIEWGDIVDDVLPKRRVIIKLERTEHSEFERRVIFNYPEEMNYLRSGL